MIDVPPLEDLKLISEIAAVLRVTPETVKNWRTHHAFPLAAWRVGNRWYTTDRAVEDFIARRTADASPPPVDAVALPRSTPIYSKRRRREIDAATERCKRRGC